MRFRINLRDIVWYRKANMIGNRVFDASPMFRSQIPPPDATSNNKKDTSKVKHSVLDDWESKMRGVFGSSRNDSV